MPSFLQSTFLAGLAALAIPLLIHLFFQLRTKRVELGTIRFLKMVLEENARRRKVMRWFLLALRLACVALLVGLFARPYFSHAGTQLDRPLHVILIDRSATMGLSGDGRRPIEQAIADVRALLGKSGGGVQWRVAMFDDAVAPLPSEKKDELLEALEKELAREHLFGGTSYGSALSWARDVLTAAGAGPKQLHLFTDLQRSGLDWTDGEPLPVGVEVHLHHYGRSVVNNIAVTELQMKKSWIRPGESANVTATVSNDGSFLLETIPVVLELGRIPADRQKEGRVDFSELAGRITMRERVRLEPGSSIPVEFSIPDLGEGEWQGRVTVEFDDELAFDNVRYFAISSSPSYRILVASGAKDRFSELSETHFLETSLRLSPAGEAFAASPFSVDVLELSEATPLPALPSYAAVVLANVPDLPAEDAERLADFVRAGRGLVIFTGDSITPETMQQLKRVKLAEPGPVMVTRDLPWRIDWWDRGHELFAPFEDPQSGNLTRLVFAAYTRLAPQTNDRVLAKFQNGDPMIVERTIDEGTVLTVATSCGQEWSDWATTRLFLPIVHQLLGYEVGLTAGGRVRTRLIGADTARTSAGRSEKKEAPKSPEQIARPGVERRPTYSLVTNSHPKESETEACLPSDFEDRFALTFATDDPDEAAPTERPAEEKNEQWPWLACGLLGVLLLESFVGNRTTA